jgi:hypothetical protein
MPHDPSLEPSKPWWEDNENITEEDRLTYRLMDETEQKVQEALEAAGLEPPFHVVFSAYNELPGDNLQEVAFAGRGIVVEDADEFWGGSEGELFFSDILTDPTWLELCVVAERMIRTVNDKHHIYLEAVSVIPRPDLQILAEADDPDGDVRGYRFFMGS